MGKMDGKKAVVGVRDARVGGGRGGSGYLRGGRERGGAERGEISDPSAAPTMMMRSNCFGGPEQLETVIVVLDAVAMATWGNIYIYIFERT